MEVPILIRNEATRYLEVNFDRDLLRLFQEVYYWRRLKEDVPFAALDLASQSDEHRIVREHVLLLVHDYNEILAALDDNERKVQMFSYDNLNFGSCSKIALTKWTNVSHRHYRNYCGSVAVLLSSLVIVANFAKK